jgi:hypothetical protein
MITPELKSYVESELGKGTAKETIRNSLLANGWAAEDVEQVFAATAASVVPPTPHAEPQPMIIQPKKQNQFIEPQVYAVEPQAQSNPVQAGAVAAPKSHKKIILTIVVLILVLLAGGGAYAYYSGSFLSLPYLASQSMANAREAKTATYDITTSIDFSELKDSGLGLDDMLGTTFTSKQFGITAQGQYDISDPDNFKNKLVISFLAGSFTPELELRMLEDTLYGKVSKMPALGFFTMLSSIENKWFSIEYKSDDGQITNNPVTAIVGIDTSTMNRLTADQKERIYEMAREAKLIKMVKKFPPETVAGELSYHFMFILDREGIAAYLQALKEYVNSVGGDSSALSVFDPTSFDEGIDSLKDFTGEIWIGRSDKLPRKLSLSFGIKPDETVDETIKIKIVSIMSGWNQPVYIVAPSDSIPFEQFMSDIMSGTLVPPEDSSSDVPDKKIKPN